MNLLKNESFCRQFALMAGAFAVIVTAAWLAGGAAAGAAALATGLVALALFATFSARRYREIAQLAAEIDRILHAKADGREIELSDYREGDVAILRNELAKMTATLRTANRRIAREKSALSDALADVSHQIRTPLTAMSLMLPLIEKNPDAHERARMLHDLETMVDRVGWLVTTLLKLAKVDAGAIHVQAVPASAATVAREAVRPLEVAFDLRGVTCDVDADESATFTGDAAWTTEALENIVKNCLEHTPEGGTVRVAVREDVLACRFVVSDTGPGIADADLPHIFERFYRGHNAAQEGTREAIASTPATSVAPKATEDPAFPPRLAVDSVRAPQGFGVGLSLAQSLVSAQGGTVHAENVAEGGARFVITFPKMTV